MLAFLLRGAVQEAVIIPVARFFWLLQGYYGAFSQAAYWVAALAIESGCEWITADRDFSRFPGLRWRTPF